MVPVLSLGAHLRAYWCFLQLKLFSCSQGNPLNSPTEINPAARLLSWCPSPYPGSRRKNLGEQICRLLCLWLYFFKAQRLWNLLLHMAGERLEAQLCPKSPNLLWKEGLSCFQQLLVMHHEHHPCAQCSRWGVRMMPVCKDKWTLLSWIGFYSHHCHVWGKCESPSAGKIGKKPTGKVKAEMNHRTSHHRMEISIVSTKRGI